MELLSKHIKKDRRAEWVSREELWQGQVPGRGTGAEQRLQKGGTRKPNASHPNEREPIKCTLSMPIHTINLQPDSRSARQGRGGDAGGLKTGLSRCALKEKTP